MEGGARGGGGTHVQDVLPQLLGLDAGQQAEQEVHDGGRADVFDHQVHEVLPLPQELHDLHGGKGEGLPGHSGTRLRGHSADTLEHHSDAPWGKGTSMWLLW